MDLVRYEKMIVEHYLELAKRGTIGNRYVAYDNYGLRHVPTHLVNLAQWELVLEFLTDFGFLEAKCTRLSVYDLEADYRTALGVISDDCHRVTLEAFANALSLESHELVVFLDN